MASKVLVRSARERALRYVERASRVQKQDLRDNPGARTQARQVRASLHNQAGHTIGELQHAAKPPAGWIWGNFYLPWQRLFPGEKHFNGDINLRREYPPLSLLELQRLIDLGWLNTERLIDLTALCNTKNYRCEPALRQFGVQLTDEGADCFKTPVNLEVQWASQSAIAAVERAGGRIRTAYYDAAALQAAVDPEKWFLSGKPIPRRRMPPASLMEYYTSAVNRGYLADAEQLSLEETRLAQLLGYRTDEVERRRRQQQLEHCREQQKRPDQLFVGVPAGAIVSLVDRKLFAPTHPVLSAHYGMHHESGAQRFADHSYPSTFSSYAPRNT